MQIEQTQKRTSTDKQTNAKRMQLILERSNAVNDCDGAVDAENVVEAAKDVRLDGAP